MSSADALAKAEATAADPLAEPGIGAHREDVDAHRILTACLARSPNRSHHGSDEQMFGAKLAVLTVGSAWASSVQRSAWKRQWVVRRSMPRRKCNESGLRRYGVCKQRSSRMK